MESKPSRPQLYSGNEPLAACDSFSRRHLGGDCGDEMRMLGALNQPSLDAFLDAVVPAHIRTTRPLELPAALGERAALEELASIAGRNRVCKSFIGQGYYGCVTPPVIQRNILENPGWYTAYTPYQAEIAQGRLEALANFQTMITDLTGLEIANASLLDEGTAAAEAVAMAHAARNEDGASVVFADANCHPQTLEVLRTRAEVLGWNLQTGSAHDFTPLPGLFAVVVQVPDTLGVIRDFRAFAARMREAGALVIAIADPLALTLIEPPGEWGADIAVGSTQRFGVPMGFGGPHAAFIATRDAHKRLLPGRLVGLSRDVQGYPAYRLALQTREQHIRRDRATSNICTAQVLLAVMASMYAVYHGPAGLRHIATRVHKLTRVLHSELSRAGFHVSAGLFFDTLHVRLAAGARDGWILRAREKNLLLRSLPDGVGISLDETTTLADLEVLLGTAAPDFEFETLKSAQKIELESDSIQTRRTAFLTHPVFSTHHSETHMLRYIRSLEAKDFSLVHSMIPLGSCTMKLNATSEMLPVSWPQFSQIHPFAPEDYTEGYGILCAQLREWLAEITGFAGISLQPNAGSQGEYAGLLVIRAYHRARGESQRTVCLIPTSAHGTNPASAVMAGMRVVAVKCGFNGDVDLADLRAKAVEHRDHLAALMVTYPSTHGVFEQGIREICACIHECGGQVYMDGANLNAQVGICRPAELGVDVCHLNLHKTFCIPHGGGGPGVGPIGVAPHLVSFLPFESVGGACAGKSIGRISAASQGSAGILPIPWMYIRMMGPDGLRRATARALLHANYVAYRLKDYFPVLYTDGNGLVAHECILDLRAFRFTTAEDVAKRLMDYGFHAPTLSWPVAGTLMVEPTESESLEEMDRFCEAMIAIHAEMTAVERGEMDRLNNPLKNAPHPATIACADKWDRPYTREIAAFPVERLRHRKWWPVVGRIDNVWGDRNLFCACAPMEETGELAHS